MPRFHLTPNSFTYFPFHLSQLLCYIAMNVQMNMSVALGAQIVCGRIPAHNALPAEPLARAAYHLQNAPPLRSQTACCALAGYNNNNIAIATSRLRWRRCSGTSWLQSCPVTGEMALGMIMRLNESDGLDFDKTTTVAPGSSRRSR